MRGIDTNNYAESGIRILKDIVFKRIKAYNLIQLFEFLTITFEAYYERRLLAIAYNRVDRYISLRYKGLGAKKVDQNDIKESTESTYMFKVKSRTRSIEYEVDTERWTCTCSVGRTGQPSGEPCKHQHAVANKYNLTAPNLVPYFNGDGRYLHAVVALGSEKAGDRSFYCGIMEDVQSALCTVNDDNTIQDMKEQTMDNDEDMDCDSGAENLDLMVGLMDEHSELQSEIVKLCNSFVEDVGEKMKTCDIPYLTGLKKILFSLPGNN